MIYPTYERLLSSGGYWIHLGAILPRDYPRELQSGCGMHSHRGLVNHPNSLLGEFLCRLNWVRSTWENMAVSVLFLP